MIVKISGVSRSELKVWSYNIFDGLNNGAETILDDWVISDLELGETVGALARVDRNEVR